MPRCGCRLSTREENQVEMPTLLAFVHLFVFGLFAWWTRTFPVVSGVLLMVALAGSALLALYLPRYGSHKNGEDKL